MKIINIIQIRNIFMRFLIIILCFCCLQANAETSSQKPQANKGIFSELFKKTKKTLDTYKTQLEMKYFEEQIKKDPKNIILLETYGQYLKDHKYYDKSAKIYKKLMQLTKNKKYQDDINETNAFKNYYFKNIFFENLIKQAQKYESQGKIKQANEYYLKAQKIMPGRYEAKFGLAKTYCWINQPQKAMKYYEELLKKVPNNIALLEGYAGCLSETKDYAQAKRIYTTLLELTKNEKYKNNIQEIISLEKGLTPKKVELASVTPEDKAFLGYVKQAQKYESQGKIKQANSYYQKAQKIYPKRYEALFGLAKTYGWMGQKKLANSLYKELLAANPDNSDIKSSYNKFLKENKPGKFYKQQAIKGSPTLAKTIASPIEGYLKQAQNYETQGNAKAANEYYLKAYNIDKTRYEAKFGLAKTYGWLHNDKLAMNYYQELLKQTPNNADLLEAYANYLKDTKNYSEAMEIYNKLLAQATEGESEKYNANIAEIYFLQQDYQTSLKLYNEIYDKNPNNPNIQKAIALLYFVLGNFNSSIEFYEKYLSQKSDKESVLNYAKSLFYLKQIEPAQKILESYVRVYPKDAEGLGTLADIYMAQKNLQQAACLVNQALCLEPDNLKLRIQSAKVDMALKDYACAEEKLLALLKTNSNNPEILENLGDISLYTERFMQALDYYQCIENYKTVSRLKYKIAQAHHYNKDYVLGEYHYAGLIKDSEYSRKARIGIAEIKIIQNKPLVARKILNRVLEEDPCNVQAKKNLAISWYTTGDNYNSIKILKSLPKDDADINDINYNLAKAYYKIERNDTALEYLENTPLKSAKTLKGEIKMITKPAVAPLYEAYYMSPSNGSANAGKYQKAGGAIYYYFRPNFRAVIMSQAAQYGNITNLVSTTALINTVGFEGQVTDHLNFRSSVGVEAFSNGPAIFLGSGLLKYSPNDFISCTSGYVRSLDEIDSYMSAAGVVPSVGPFANQLVGRIIDNKYVLFNIGLKLPHKAYAYGGMNVGNKYGSNSPSNFYREIMWGLGKIFYSGAETKPINQALLGYDFYYTGYNYDRSGFGGANLDFSPIGSDGTAIDPATGFPGTGGYFSPTFFLANKFPVTFKGTFRESKLKYVLSAFIGTQTIQGQIGLLGPTPGGPSEFRTTPYFGYSVGLRYNEKGRVSMAFDYIFNNYMTVAQHLLRASLLIRF